MNPLLNYFLLALAVFVIGRGIIRLLKIDNDFRITLPVSFILGVGIIALLPFLLELFYIAITPRHLFLTISLITGLTLIPLITGRRHLRRPSFALPRLYDLPFLFVAGIIIFISIWRCYYNPVMPRDMLSGPEVIAAYTLKEHTMVNSVFSLDLWNNNNQFKPPSITSLQVIYKMAGFPFGQVWLSILFIAFTGFLYQLLIKKLHSLIAGLLILLFLAIPEMYAYTYMVLFDYPNTIFFTLSCYYFFRYFEDDKINELFLAGILMGIATYFRSETLLLALLLLPVLLFYSWRKKASLIRMAFAVTGFIILSVILYWLPNGFYNNHYLPVHYDIGELINKHPFQLDPLYKRFMDMNQQLMFGEFAIRFYGYFTYFFIAFTLLELAIYRRFTREGKNWQYAVLIIFLGLPFIGFLLPLMDLLNTTKRGLFKMFPLMLLYMGNCRPLIVLSEKIKQWELPAPAINRIHSSPVHRTANKLQTSPKSSPPKHRKQKG